MIPNFPSLPKILVMSSGVRVGRFSCYRHCSRRYLLLSLIPPYFSAIYLMGDGREGVLSVSSRENLLRIVTIQYLSFVKNIERIRNDI